MKEHASPRGRVLLFCFAVALSSCSHGTKPPRDIIATYSIVAFDPKTGDLGVAVQSKFFGVGTVVPWAKSGVGAIATQSAANIIYGADGLRLLTEGRSPGEAIELLTQKDAAAASRQCGIVDAQGRSAAFTGEGCFAFASHRTAKNVSVQGNILAGPGVLDAMLDAFYAAQKIEGSELADWLVAAIQAGEDAGGDRRGRQSAAMLVVRDKAGYGGAGDRYIDLRVDDHRDPTHELARLLEIHKRFYPDKHALKPAR